MEKAWNTVVAGILLIPSPGAMAACGPNDESIDGHYPYEEAIYLGPLSSYMATKENAAD